MRGDHSDLIDWGSALCARNDRNRAPASTRNCNCLQAFGSHHGKLSSARQTHVFIHDFYFEYYVIKALLCAHRTRETLSRNPISLNGWNRLELFEGLLERKISGDARNELPAPILSGSGKRGFARRFRPYEASLV